MCVCVRARMCVCVPCKPQKVGNKIMLYCYKLVRSGQKRLRSEQKRPDTARFGPSGLSFEVTRQFWARLIHLGAR